MRLRRLAMVGVALLPVIGVAATASAADGGAENGWKKVRVSFTAVVPENNLLATECQESDPELCLYISSVPNMTLSGGMVGTVDAGNVVGTSSSGISALVEVGSSSAPSKDVARARSCTSGGRSSSRIPRALSRTRWCRGRARATSEGITGTISINLDDSLTAVFRCKRH